MSAELLRANRREIEIRRDRQDCDPQDVLRLLGDEDTQRMVECADAPLTAAEFAERCGLALSTAYRKIEQLTEAGLLEQSLRLTSNGHHPTQYRRAIDGVAIAVDGTDQLTVVCRK